MRSQKVAFVCLHGSAKSLIAAEYFNRLAVERNLPFRATTSGPEPYREVPENVVAGLKSRGIDVRAVPACADHGRETRRHRPDRVVRLRRLASSKPEERWDECPAVSSDFDTAWTFITGRVEKLISRLAVQ